MFQAGRRPRPEFPPVYCSEDPRKEPKWRLALQRIRLGIFSHKDTPRPTTRSADPSWPLHDFDEQCMNPWTRESPKGREARNPFSRFSRKGSQAATLPERPQRPSEVNNTRTYNFFRRTLTKSRGQKIPANEEHIQFRQHRRRYTLLSRPISTIHVPPKDPAEQEQRPSTAAYIPQHAATDFKRMSNYGPQFEEHIFSQQLKRVSFNPNHSMTLRSTAFGSDGEAADFRSFLAQSRAEAARTLESSDLHSPNKIMPSEAEKIMGEIEANYRAATKDLLRPTTSTSKRLSRSGSFLEKIGDYYKPVETGATMKDRNPGAAVMSQTVPVARTASRRSTIARPVSRGESFMIAVGEYIKPSNADYQPGGVNNPRTGQFLTVADAERQTKRPSMMSEASRRSTSQERDIDWDGREARASWVSSTTFGRTRSSTMPTSPGLDQYNRIVRKGY
ncbi:hypothetical protein V8E51_015127 [Hyaloscypha variabilis]